MEQQRKEAKEFLDDLVSRDQRMMFGLATIVHSADSKKQLDRDTETLLSVARKHLCQLAVLKYQQMDGLNTALPYGLRKINAMRTLTTESTAVLMPFRAHEIMDIGGTYCGMNAISHNLIIADRKQLINGNGFILGVSGSGKSFFTKREIVSLTIKPEAVDPEDVEMLQDMVMAAVNEALRQGEENREKTMSALAPAGMGGMF